MASDVSRESPVKTDLSLLGEPLTVLIYCLQSESRYVSRWWRRN